MMLVKGIDEPLPWYKGVCVLRCQILKNDMLTIPPSPPPLHMIFEEGRLRA